MRLLYILRCFGGVFWLTNFANSTHAQPVASVAPHASLPLTAAGPPLDVSVTAAEAGSILSVGKLKVALALSGVTELRAEAVQLKGGATVGVVRVTGAGKNAAVLVARRGAGLEALWTGMLQFSGDPGERRADALELGDRDGDGTPDVVVGVYDERIRVCGEDHSLLSPRAVDPQTLTLRSVLLNRASGRTPTLQLTASVTPAAPQSPPLLHSLRTVGASSSDPAAQHGAQAVTDGDLATTWVEGRGLGGRFEFVTLHWGAPGRAITALAVVPKPPAAADGGNAHARIRVLSLLGPKGERWVATLPEDAHPGQRYWIVPPTPLSWDCMTLSIDDVYATDVSARTHAMLAEVEAYTDLDQAGGLPSLIAEMADPGPRGDDATQLLQQAQGDVTGAIADGWDKLSPVGKRRALRLAFRSGTKPDPRTPDVLRRALRDPDAAVSQQALGLAKADVAVGNPLLVELAGAATPQGDRAALAIAHNANASTLAALLAALVASGGSERPTLRDAIAIAYRAVGGSAANTVHGWVEAGAPPPPTAARASLALALSRVPEASETTLALVRDSVEAADQFADQWRLVQAAGALAAEPQIDSWLTQVAQQAKPWMLRTAALDALRTRNADAARTVARAALGDDYPRVRSAALKTLADDPSAFDVLAKLAREDKWFLVRQAALDQLPDSDGARALFLAALADQTPTVRAAAVRALARVRSTAAWSKIKPLVANGEEYPEVIAEGIGFARSLCVQDAIPALEAVVTRGMRPEAWTGDQDLALSALDALSNFGGAAAVWARDHGTGPLVPKEMQSAAAAAAQKPATCRISPAL